MRTIGNTPVDGEVRAVASGTLPSGQPVIVNADGTVSVVSGNDEGAGTGAQISTDSNLSQIQAIYDPDSGKVIIAYHRDANSYYGAAVVGTISGTNISFGNITKFQANNSQGMQGLSMAYDTSEDKVLIVYADKNNSTYGTGIVGTISGTSISFGTAAVFQSSSINKIQVAFDQNSNKFLVVYMRNFPQARVITVSGTSISSGNETKLRSDTDGNMQRAGIAFSTSANKFVLVYRDQDQSSKGQYVVGTISGTSVSYGTAADLNNVSSGFQMRIAYDATLNKFIAVYIDAANSNYGKARVGTLSGTTVSWGSIAVFNSAATLLPDVLSDGSGNFIISFCDGGNSDRMTFVSAVVSDTSVSFGSKVIIEAVVAQSGSQLGLSQMAYDSANNKFVIPYNDITNGNIKAAVLQLASTTLTSENYIGMSSGSVSSNSVAQALGSAVVFESAAVSSNVASTFDSNSNKVVIVYQDTANSFYGTAIVGTVSGASISFGSPVVFSSANRTQEIQITFDSNSNKVVIAYDDKADGQKGKAIVGTVSGTNISFGSAVVFNNGSTDLGTPNAITFDSNSNKVVIAFQDKADSNKGKAIVGTVSGTSISFGSEATFLNANYATQVSTTFDSNSNKVVIVYKDGSNSTHGYAVVGTVSGTSISFGTPVVFESAETNKPNVAFDTVNNKIVIAYADGTVGTAIVGTVSGTAISFGSPVIFNSTETTSPRVRFDATASKMIVAYGEGSGNAGTFKTGTVSETSISFGSATVFESGSTNGQNGLVYDSNAGKMVLSYYSGSNSGYGTSKVLQTSFTTITRDQVASGSSAIIDSGCAISTNQLSLTAGQQYFVQTDGTLGLTAADPSVLAGTAVSATKLIVKG